MVCFNDILFWKIVERGGLRVICNIEEENKDFFGFFSSKSVSQIIPHSIFIGDDRQERVSVMDLFPVDLLVETLGII